MCRKQPKYKIGDIVTTNFGVGTITVIEDWWGGADGYDNRGVKTYFRVMYKIQFPSSLYPFGCDHYWFWCCSIRQDIFYNVKTGEKYGTT